MNSMRRSSACAAPRVPIPYARHLEQAAIPQVDTIFAAALPHGEPACMNFVCPRSGRTWKRVRLVEWLTKPGDEVKRGQVVAVIETQKGAVDVEIWEAGTVDKLIVETGQKVPVVNSSHCCASRANLRLRILKRALKHLDRSALQTVPALAICQFVTRSKQRLCLQQASARLRVSPSARKLAEELGIRYHIGGCSGRNPAQ